MIGRFLRYSLENGRRIALVYLDDGRIVRKNAQVTALDETGGAFRAVLSGRKKEITLPLSAVLTADYARGDHGELED